MNINEAIEVINNIDTLSINDMIVGQNVDMVIKNQVIDILKQIDTQPKVVVPKFVAEWYEKHKESLDYDLYLYLMTIYDETSEKNDFYYWMQKSNNPIQTLINMHQFGYEVEKEQLYTVEIAGSRLTKITRGNTTIFKLLPLDNISDVFDLTANYTDKLTEQEIKQKDERLWQFAKPVQEEVE